MGLQELPQDVLRKVFLLVLSSRDDVDVEDNRSAWALAQCSRYLLQQFSAFFMTSISYQSQNSLSHSLALCRVAGGRGLTTLSTGSSTTPLTTSMELSAAAACPLDTIAAHCQNIRRLDFGLWSPNCGIAFRRVLHICSNIESLTLRDPPENIIQVLKRSLAASCLPSLSHLCLTFQANDCRPIETSGGRDLLASASPTAADGIQVVSPDQVESISKSIPPQSYPAGSPEKFRCEGQMKNARPASISLEPSRQCNGRLSRATRSPRRISMWNPLVSEQGQSLFSSESEKAPSALEVTH